MLIVIFKASDSIPFLKLRNLFEYLSLVCELKIFVKKL